MRIMAATPLSIYIPLCFYLYESVVQIVRLTDTIYIPLCFYLYRYAFRRSPSAISAFTFHYASTYTNLCRHVDRYLIDLHSTMLLLIQDDRFIRLCTVVNLHSTMLLLIRCLRSRARCRSIIYIPLCFYLYSSELLYPITQNKFTFHYASTYTVISGMYVED